MVNEVCPGVQLLMKYAMESVVNEVCPGVQCLMKYAMESKG